MEAVVRYALMVTISIHKAFALPYPSTASLTMFKENALNVLLDIL